MCGTGGPGEGGNSWWRQEEKTRARKSTIYSTLPYTYTHYSLSLSLVQECLVRVREVLEEKKDVRFGTWSSGDVREGGRGQGGKKEIRKEEERENRERGEMGGVFKRGEREREREKE